MKKTNTQSGTITLETFKVPISPDILMNALVCVQGDTKHLAHYVFEGNSYCEDHYLKMKTIYSDL